MALKRVTPGLTDTTLVTGKKIRNSDIDLTFNTKPGALNEAGVMQGDIYKKHDAAAVIQAVENILLTNHFEKPFNPFFGGNLRAMLFETVENYSEPFVRDMVTQAIERDEPRAKVVDVKFYDGKDAIRRGAQTLRDNFRNTIYIRVEFRVETQEGTLTAAVNMNRLR